MDSVLPLKYEEIEELVKEKNITEKQYYIWTDFERLNLTHFRISVLCHKLCAIKTFSIFIILYIRSKSDQRFPSITRKKIHHLYYSSANDFEIDAQKWFYNIVLAHGNGTILNIPPPGHLSLELVSNWNL